MSSFVLMCSTAVIAVLTMTLRWLCMAPFGRPVVPEV